VTDAENLTAVSAALQHAVDYIYDDFLDRPDGRPSSTALSHLVASQALVLQYMVALTTRDIVTYRETMAVLRRSFLSTSPFEYIEALCKTTARRP